MKGQRLATCLKLLSLSVLASSFILATDSQASFGEEAPKPPTPQERLKLARQAVVAVPRDAQKRFELGEALRLTGDQKDAAIEYLNTTCLDPAYYIAYHQMLKTKPTVGQVEEAYERLNKLEEQKPKNLMLRVALSELLEQKGDLYGAARQLVDLQYVDNIPSKYQLKISTRVHYLLTKAKDVKTAETAEKSLQQTEEEIDSVPLPLPESSLNNNLSVNKLKDDKIPDGYGHTHLLP